MKRLFGLLLAVLLIAFTNASSAAYASFHAPPGMTSVSGPRPQAASPDVATPAMLGSYIAMVLDQPSTPCFNCVNGHEVGTFGSGDPIAYVQTQNTALKMLYVYFNVSYTHQCTITVSLTQGTTVLRSASGTFSPPPAVGNSTVKVTRAATWHGAALMTGKLVCGTLTVINNGTVWFQ